jgi:hypothetical protein
MKSFLKVILLSLIIFGFSTCDTPMGMGEPIDFLSPVLTLFPVPPTPMYVGLGAELTGTATDNKGVDRVILRDSITGEQLFTAVLFGGGGKPATGQ